MQFGTYSCCCVALISKNEQEKPALSSTNLQILMQGYSDDRSDYTNDIGEEDLRKREI